MNLSVVVPLLNEEESLHELYARINKVCQENQLSYEIWFVDDGSTDSSWQIIENLSKENHHVHGIKFSRNYGKSQALHAAFEKVQGDVVITMDADLQDFPEEIPELYNKIVELKPEWHDEDPQKGVIKVIMTGTSSDQEHLQRQECLQGHREHCRPREHHRISERISGEDD